MIQEQPVVRLHGSALPRRPDTHTPISSSLVAEMQDQVVELAGDGERPERRPLGVQGGEAGGSGRRPAPPR